MIKKGEEGRREKEDRDTERQKARWPNTPPTHLPPSFCCDQPTFILMEEPPSNPHGFHSRSGIVALQEGPVSRKEDKAKGPTPTPHISLEIVWECGSISNQSKLPTAVSQGHRAIDPGEAMEGGPSHPFCFWGVWSSWTFPHHGGCGGEDLSGCWGHDTEAGPGPRRRIGTAEGLHCMGSKRSRASGMR